MVTVNALQVQFLGVCPPKTFNQILECHLFIQIYTMRKICQGVLPCTVIHWRSALLFVSFFVITSQISCLLAWLAFVRLSLVFSTNPMSGRLSACNVSDFLFRGSILKGVGPGNPVRAALAIRFAGSCITRVGSDTFGTVVRLPVVTLNVGK